MMDAIDAVITDLPAETIIDMYTVTKRDVRVSNTAEKEEELKVVTMCDSKGKHKFPTASLTMLRWKS